MNPNRNRKRGKDTERALAKLLNAKRIGILGSEDLSHPIFSYEVKSRKAFVALDWLEQAKRNCPEGKTPVLVVHVNGRNHNKDCVIIDLDTWRGLHVETDMQENGNRKDIVNG